MPVIAGRTAQQLRESVAWNLMGADFHLGTTTSSVDATSVLDTSLQRGDNDYNGWWERQTSGNNDEETRLVTDYVAATGDLTVVAHTNSVASGVSFELWRPWWNPEMIDQFLQDTLLDLHGYTYDPVEDLSVHLYRARTRFDLPSDLAVITKIEYRDSVDSLQVHAMERDFDQSPDPTGWSLVVDTDDYARGSTSIRFDTTGSAVNGTFMDDGFSALNLRPYTHIEGMWKASGTLAAADWVLHLDDGVIVGGTSDLENIDMPALTVVDSWQPFRIALARPEDDNAIISLGLEYSANIKENNVWFDDIQAVNIHSEDWVKLSRRAWNVDKEANDLTFKKNAVENISYALLKITGGDEPSLFTADANVSEVDGAFLIARTCELAFEVAREVDEEKYYRRMISWAQRAEKAKKGLSRQGRQGRHTN